MGQVSRRALLARAGTGAGALALLGVSATPALAAPSEGDLSNVRLVCSTKRLMINWYTTWVDTPKAAGPTETQDLVRTIRKQEQAHYAALAPLLGATAPTDDDFTFTFPAGALRTPATAAKFALALEYLATGIAVGAAARVLDVGVAGTLTSVVACEGQHLGALSALGGGSPVPTDLPAGLDIVDASNQLSPFLSN
jgi:Ferritin-like domain